MGQHTPVERLSVFADGQLVEYPTADRTAVLEARERDGWLWLELVHAREQDWHEVAEDFGLHHLAVEDMIEAGQRTKLDQYGDHSFLVLHPAAYDEAAERVGLGELHVYIGRDFLITHRSADTPAPDAARHRVETTPALAALGPRGAAYAVIDRVVDDYEPVLGELSTDLSQIDESLFAQEQGDVATRVYKLAREVGHFQRAVEPLEELLVAARKALSGDDPELLLGAFHEEHLGTAPESDPALPSAPPTVVAAQATSGATSLSPASAGTPGERHHGLTAAARHRHRVLLEALLRDVLDHAQRVASRLDGMHSTLVNALSLAMTLSSERAAQVGLEQNDQTKKVSSWAAILAAPAVLAGVWGMNFRVMPELELAWGYPAALVTMLGACSALYAVFKKKGWL